MAESLFGLKGASRLIRRNADVISILIAFSVIATLLSYLRFANFYDTNWDLGINMQMLWSTLHGKILYESGDFSTVGTKSFLLVHSTYIALLVSLIYAALPYSTTLFTLQSISIAVSGLFVFLLSFHETGKRYISLLVLFSYLSSFIVISSLLYDYHWEAMIPAETLALFYLWDKGKYRLSALPFILGCCTLEVFPFLAAGLALYFLSRDVEWKSYRTFFKRLAAKRVRMSLILMLCSVFAYGVIRLMQYYVLPRAFNQPNVYPSSYTAGSFIFLLGVFHPDLNVEALTYWILIYASFAFIPFLHPRHLLMQLPWFLATITLLPVANTGVGGFGVQYPLIALPAIGIGLSRGISILQPNSQQKHATIKAPSSENAWLHYHVFPYFSSVATFLILIYYIALDILLVVVIYPLQILSNTGRLRNLYVFLMSAPLISLFVYGVFLFFSDLCHRQLSKRCLFRSSNSYIDIDSRTKDCRNRVLFTGIVLALLLFNIFMSPVNPGNMVKSAPTNGGYSFSLGLSNLSVFVYKALQLVPPGSTIVASDNLFPFVANNLNSYSLPYSTNMVIHLPFNSSNLPDYLLVDTSMMFGPSYIVDNMFNATIYGIRSFIYAPSYPGSIYLFQKGYFGPTVDYRLGLFQNTFYIKPTELFTLPNGVGHILPSKSGKFVNVISTENHTVLTNTSNTIWYGPYMTFPAGNYSVTFSLMSGSFGYNLDPRVPLIYIDSSSIVGSSPLLISKTLFASQLSRVEWTNVTCNITLSKPFPFLEFRGYLISSNGRFNGYVILNYIHIHRY